MSAGAWDAWEPPSIADVAIMLHGRISQCAALHSLFPDGLFFTAELPGGRLPSSAPESLRAVGRGIAERRRARHHLGEEPAGRRAQRQSPMGVAVGEP